jgi:hypothetical protein
MKKLNLLWAICGITAALAFSATPVLAQGGGGYGGGFGAGGMTLTSPQRLQQRLDSMRVTLAVTNDDEWSVISPRLVKVIQLKAEEQAEEVVNMVGGMAGNRAGGVRAAVTALGVENDPATLALTKAITDEAPVAELKSTMARYRQARKAKQAEIAGAQAALLAVVSVRQEAILLSNGLLE